MLVLKVTFDVNEAMFEDDRFCGYRFLKSQTKEFENWFQVLQFIQDGFTADIQYEIQNVEPKEIICEEEENEELEQAAEEDHAITEKSC